MDEPTPSRSQLYTEIRSEQVTAHRTGDNEIALSFGDLEDVQVILTPEAARDLAAKLATV